MRYPDTVFAKIDRNGPLPDFAPELGGCWLWTGAITGTAGYSSVWVHGRPLSGHRAVYELLVGPVPEGMHMDHLCRVRRCVNPDHLEVVTQAENNRRRSAVITHCPAGHEYTEANTYWMKYKFGRQCRTCHRLRSHIGFHGFSSVREYEEHARDAFEAEQEMLDADASCRGDAS